MADEHDVHFESADAGASLTFPQQAGTIRKNGFIVIKNRPCKVFRESRNPATLLPAPCTVRCTLLLHTCITCEGTRSLRCS